MAEWLNLEDLVWTMLKTPQLGPESLVAWGGAFDADQVEVFLKLWSLPCDAMSWGLWQWTDNIALLYQKPLPDDLDYLERGRVFGPGGDLALRRDGVQFLWQYVSQNTQSLPAAIQLPEYQVANYWTGRPATWRLRGYERTALLWGEYVPQAGHWYDDRVGWATLRYPPLEGKSVVQVRYVEYLYGGSIELVHLLGLEQGQDREEAHNG